MQNNHFHGGLSSGNLLLTYLHMYIRILIFTNSYSLLIKQWIVHRIHALIWMLNHYNYPCSWRHRALSVLALNFKTRKYEKTTLFLKESETWRLPPRSWKLNTIILYLLTKTKAISLTVITLYRYLLYQNWANNLS